LFEIKCGFVSEDKKKTWNYAKKQRTFAFAKAELIFDFFNHFTNINKSASSVSTLLIFTNCTVLQHKAVMREVP